MTYSKWSVTNFIITLHIILYFASNIFDPTKIFFGLNDYFLVLNLWHQPLTTLFIHSDIMHIFMNMFLLFIFGNMLEQEYGKMTLLILYFIGGIITSLGSYAFMCIIGMHHNLIGASGAISVLFGFIANKNPLQRKGLIIWLLLISFVPLALGENIGWYAHLIGFGVGFFAGLLHKLFK